MRTIFSLGTDEFQVDFVCWRKGQVIIVLFALSYNGLAAGCNLYVVPCLNNCYYASECKRVKLYAEASILFRFVDAIDVARDASR